ncbi:hypothetical protein [Cellulomonas aerilata]|uniref:Uncharacterized protein n=1 Tax=Cellulomonas aerilata TaxID=515326 RepID=A0A512D8W6_9CELL|nr:hypothetical protein [Cellulomonas aerilata]GEO32926.1 hypothetical protein CAE01nite_06510 [Cellulomonas aerilata]
MADDELRVEITDADIRTAKRAWLAARDGGAPEDRVQRLFDGYERLVNAQAQQIADDFRRRRDSR